MPRQATPRQAEIAELLGVTRQRVNKLVDERGFPRPIQREPHRLWDQREVAAWARRWRNERPWR